MPPESFLHLRDDFKALAETVADSEKINDPALVEQDYWIMHAVFGLKQVGLTFELKGCTSLSKGFVVIHRFSEDISGPLFRPPDHAVRTVSNDSANSSFASGVVASILSPHSRRRWSQYSYRHGSSVCGCSR
jgi:hypothetical protein